MGTSTNRSFKEIRAPGQNGKPKPTGVDCRECCIVCTTRGFAFCFAARVAFELHMDLGLKLGCMVPGLTIFCFEIVLFRWCVIYVWID